MDAIVQLAGPVSQADSYALDELAEGLLQDGLAPSVQKAPPAAGRKDGGLTLAISLASLGLSAIGTLVSVLSFWRSTHPEYKILIKRAGVEVAIENPNTQQIREATAALTADGEDSPSIVSISKT